MSDNGPTGMVNVKNPGSTLTAPSGDGTSDDTSAIQAIINHVAGNTDNQVFFPPGEYLVSSDIVIPRSVELHGSEIGIAVIKASTPYAYKITNTAPVTSVAMKNLYLDGILVDFGSKNIGAPSTSDITVFQSVFFSTASPSNSSGKNASQLRFRNLAIGDVDKCVFLRDSNAFGVASSFRKTVDVDVHDNVFGLDLSKIDWLSTELEPVAFWMEQKQKLGFLKTHYSLAADQGFFRSCLYDHCDRNMTIQKNVFNGSPNTGLKQDHVIYLNGFDSMKVISNYARGWLPNASGCIKARNGQRLHIARNYIDDTGILLYSHTKTKSCLYDGLKDVVVYGNHIVLRNNPDDGKSVIRYYEPHFTGTDENIRYSANEFEILGVNNPNNYRCIWLTNGNQPSHHVYQDNVYYNTNTPVRLQARRFTPSYEQGNIDASISAEYSYLPYELNIPTY